MDDIPRLTPEQVSQTLRIIEIHKMMRLVTEAKEKAMRLTWTASTYDGETIYEATSSFGQLVGVYPRALQPDPYLWTIDRTPEGLWTLIMTDPDLLPAEDAGLEFTTLEAAKGHCEMREAELTRKA